MAEWLECRARRHSVRVNSCVSPPVTVTSGVPQGTVLGPLLLLCYSADLTNTVKYSTISMFADDTKLYKGIDTVQDCYLLQEDLPVNCVSHWADIWQMELNPDKISFPLVILKSISTTHCKVQLSER